MAFFFFSLHQEIISFMIMEPSRIWQPYTKADCSTLTKSPTTILNLAKFFFNNLILAFNQTNRTIISNKLSIHHLRNQSDKWRVITQREILRSKKFLNHIDNINLHNMPKHLKKFKREAIKTWRFIKSTISNNHFLSPPLTYPLLTTISTNMKI